jgi:hypothetical protein
MLGTSIGQRTVHRAKSAAIVHPFHNLHCSAAGGRCKSWNDAYRTRQAGERG